MVHASVSGAVDFTACDGSNRWWAGARLKLDEVARILRSDVLTLHAQRAIGAQSMAALNQTPDYLQKYAFDAIKQVEDSGMPWLADASGQNKPADPLDAIAAWYAVFGADTKDPL
jgi:hypothetical protein